MYAYKLTVFYTCGYSLFADMKWRTCKHGFGLVIHLPLGESGLQGNTENFILYFSIPDVIKFIWLNYLYQLQGYTDNFILSFGFALVVHIP